MQSIYISEDKTLSVKYCLYEFWGSEVVLWYTIKYLRLIIDAFPWFEYENLNWNYYTRIVLFFPYIKSDWSGFMEMHSDEISRRSFNEKSFWKFEKIPMKIPRRSRIFREVTIFLRPPLHNHFCWVLVNKWFIQVFLNYFASVRHYSVHQLNIAWA